MRKIYKEWRERRRHYLCRRWLTAKEALISLVGQESTQKAYLENPIPFQSLRYAVNFELATRGFKPLNKKSFRNLFMQNHHKFGGQWRLIWWDNEEHEIYFRL